MRKPSNSLEMTFRAFEARSDEEKALWSFGNGILYQMCRSHPLHNDEAVVAGKIWLIGRSYAAAIERGAISNFKGDDFYLKAVVPMMIDVGAELDERIAAINRLCENNDADMHDLLGRSIQTHKFLVDRFHEISKKRNRSLASKYLHFHCPRAFFIYDTRATNTLTRWVKANEADNSILRELHQEDYDTEYATFVCKAISLHSRLSRLARKTLTPRDIDDFLLWSSTRAGSGQL